METTQRVVVKRGTRYGSLRDSRLVVQLEQEVKQYLVRGVVVDEVPMGLPQVRVLKGVCPFTQKAVGESYPCPRGSDFLRLQAATLVPNKETPLHRYFRNAPRYYRLHDMAGFAQRQAQALSRAA